MDDKVIQTIVMRAKYPDSNGGTRSLRKGKLISQACHSSVAFLAHKWHKPEFVSHEPGVAYELLDNPQPLSEEEIIWLENSFTKVCLSVDTEEELLAIYDKAKEAGLTVHRIVDSGLTEFALVPTLTCLAIGPHYKSKIDLITKDLSLF